MLPFFAAVLVTFFRYNYEDLRGVLEAEVWRVSWVLCSQERLGPSQLIEEFIKRALENGFCYTSCCFIYSNFRHIILF